MSTKVNKFERFYMLCLALGLELNEKDMNHLRNMGGRLAYISKQRCLMAKVKCACVNQDIETHGKFYAARRNKVSIFYVYQLLAKRESK